MAFTCNIDRRGRTMRTFAGAATLIAGLALLAATMVLSSTPADPTELGADWNGQQLDEDRNIAFLVAGIAACVGGAFMLFEGLVGWCAVRAMGIRTPV